MIVALTARPGSLVPGLFLGRGPTTAAGTGPREAAIPGPRTGSIGQEALPSLSIRSGKLKVCARIHPDTRTAPAVTSPEGDHGDVRSAENPLGHPGISGCLASGRVPLSVTGTRPAVSARAGGPAGKPGLEVIRHDRATRGSPAIHAEDGITPGRPAAGQPGHRDRADRPVRPGHQRQLVRHAAGRGPCRARLMVR